MVVMMVAVVGQATSVLPSLQLGSRSIFAHTTYPLQTPLCSSRRPPSRHRACLKQSLALMASCSGLCQPAHAQAPAIQRDMQWIRKASHSLISLWALFSLASLDLSAEPSIRPCFQLLPHFFFSPFVMHGSLYFPRC